MKTTLRVLLTISFVLSISYTQAQIKFGPKLGLNLSTITLKTGGVSFDPTVVAGVNFGLVSEITLKNDFYLQPGILFSTKGSKYDALGDTKFTTNNIEIPINALYKFNTGSVNLFTFAGPYVGFAVGGKINSGGVSTDLKFSGADKDLNAFDFGLNFGAGIEINSFQISAQYGLGLANLAPSNGTMKNGVLGVSVAHLFGGK
jgi:hypothetical protein